MTFALINRVISDNCKEIDGVEIGKIVVVAMVKDVQVKPSRTILNVSDETDHGKIIQSLKSET